MTLEKLKLALALTGSYCTFEKVLTAAECLAEKYDILPIMSENASKTETRFGQSAVFISRLEKIAGKKVLSRITEVEPIGPQNMADVLLIAPCTGNTLAKLAHGITDTAVTMAAKSHLRSGKPVLLAVSTNDGLSGSAQNIGALLQRKNIYFVPFYQDNPEAKPTSLAANYDILEDAIEAAYRHEQLQPIING
ncbi:MAG: dipicolinate synthase subunit B [Oscillospiraceae bacterium]|nr:dipicolinate synthase subunit B [Oscillospiraceae bacterium]